MLGERLRSYSDRQLPIWRAATAIYPSIYLEPFCPMLPGVPGGGGGGPAVGADCVSRNTAFIASVVREAMRVAQLGAASLGPVSTAVAPVIPFIWQYYLGTPPGSNSTHLVSVQEMSASLTVPMGLGAAGVVIWFDEEVNAPSTGTARFPVRRRRIVSIYLSICSCIDASTFAFVHYQILVRFVHRAFLYDAIPASFPMLN